MQVYKILLPLNVDEPFDYVSDIPLMRGDFVNVPFRGSKKLAVVWGKGESEVEEYKIKKIEDKPDLPALNENLLKFIEWVAAYNLSHIGNVLKMCMSVKFGGKRNKHEPIIPDFTLTGLTETQDEISKILRAKVSNAKYCATLLDGVTGSGKTEVYFEAIDEALNEGKQALVLLPEIALSYQWLERFRQRFGVEPGVWHSARTPKQRRETWLDVAEGKTNLIVGARSALFLPFNNLGLIVVDEEHEQSYKQEEGVIYHGRDMAVVRASIEHIPIVLASATPSLETMHNVDDGKYELLHLPERFGGAHLPKINVIDMRLEKLPADEFLSHTLKEELTQALEKKQQSVLFLNRRGYAPLLLCRACGYRVQCPNCTAWLVLHKSHKSLECHHCGFRGSVPEACPACEAEEKLHPCGPGVERIYEEVKNSFPSARVEVLASDSIKKADEIVTKMGNHEIDILVGTQMIAKGHHFPKLAFVGIVDADLGLEGGDLRAMERTYQLMHQVAGRAGRESDVGKVLIQSYMPENSAIAALIGEERNKFIKSQLAEREKFGMPPFGRLATIVLSGKNEKLVGNYISKLALAAPKSDNVEVLGPAPAPMSYLRGQHRHRLIIKTARNINIQKYIKNWTEKTHLPPSIKMKIDIDPYSFV
ncbi:MAG: primosomal protein N' [Alphaproteobacteria bacterium CG11_big_fil_rev_8_21_14_0_20_44_7]|nr:MAG: primosomal protein N' [Alphaproteobacteria bacterium CG11_big_fil_rev_8_21_14_0_20_44_7]